MAVLPGCATEKDAITNAQETLALWFEPETLWRPVKLYRQGASDGKLER
jgi:hypothetical protein